MEQSSLQILVPDLKVEDKPVMFDGMDRKVLVKKYN